ncbi:hypothetical protein An09g03520 [Aspergillus niger]|uniref:Uncharacterized protein n=2 Tax=Aspergillus niger TaxID=5061 RepID=A2QTW7_ASPNC|nr:hypothetical protein An09g03520 [Aspergillus niger]CAK96795.1 hypothetical protein An09g03520 [Aspergillus niger]
MSSEGHMCEPPSAVTQSASLFLPTPMVADAAKRICSTTLLANYDVTVPQVHRKLAATLSDHLGARGADSLRKRILTFMKVSRCGIAPHRWIRDRGCFNLSFHQVAIANVHGIRGAMTVDGYLESRPVDLELNSGCRDHDRGVATSLLPLY